MNTSLISIIIPVYNSEHYLARCIDSILAQTYSHFELILVDDGSTDRSGVIADDYAKKDKRIKVFHKPNAGVSHTRNYGLSQATGEWIAFVDSDDALSDSFLEELLKATTPVTDFCLCNFTMTNWDGNNYPYETFRVGRKQEKTISNLYNCGWMFSIGILFRKAFLTDNHLFFPEHINYTEDVWFITRAIYYANCIKKTEQSLYLYNTGNPNSITHLSHNETAENMRMNCMTETIAFLQANNSFNGCKKAIYSRILVWKSYIALYPELFDRFNDQFVEANAYIWINQFLSMKMKIMLWLLSRRLFLPAKMLSRFYNKHISQTPTSTSP